MSLNVEGQQLGELSDAIESAFNSPMLLQPVLLFKLNDNIFNYAGFGAQYPEIRFQLVTQYNDDWAIDKLVAALLEAKPTNEKLAHFAWQHGVIQRERQVAGANSRALQRMLDPKRGYGNPAQFLQRFGQILSAVCRVEVETNKGTAYGTGFLIGNTSIITNYHVVEYAIKKTLGANHKRVTFRFDYRKGPDGAVLSDGRTYRPIDDEQNWIVDDSSYDPLDLQKLKLAETMAKDRPSDHLDYAVIRVDGTPGTDPLGEKPLAGAPPRGTLSMPPAGHDFASDFNTNDAALYIMQHPKGDPLVFDMEKPAVLGLNPNQTRVFYKMNTEHGSSGSPCFNARLDWIALHHAGDPDWGEAHVPEYNQGIPLERIRTLLNQRGKLQAATI
jgi:hypothetical protein